MTPAEGGVRSGWCIPTLVAITAGAAGTQRTSSDGEVKERYGCGDRRGRFGGGMLLVGTLAERG